MSKLNFSFVGINNGRISVMLPNMNIKDEPILCMTEAQAVEIIARDGNNSIVFEDTCNNPVLHHRPGFNKEDFKMAIVKERQKGMGKSDGKEKESKVSQPSNG